MSSILARGEKRIYVGDQLGHQTPPRNRNFCRGFASDFKEAIFVPLYIPQFYEYPRHFFPISLHQHHYSHHHQY